MIIQGKDVKVYDNGGQTNDRFTIVINGSVYGMNAIPFHLGYGFNQYCGMVSEGYVWNEKCGKEVHDIKELPDEVVKAIISRFEEKPK
jgi:hypothetical protein